MIVNLLIMFTQIGIKVWRIKTMQLTLSRAFTQKSSVHAQKARPYF